MVAINPQAIIGKWKYGVALDFHTISSTPTGPDQFGKMQFHTVRTELGELLYRLKYRSDQAVARDIVHAAVMFLQPHRAKLDLMVPVPPSTARATQPVVLLAQGIAQALGLPISQCLTVTRSTEQLKNVTDGEKRKQLLNGLYRADLLRIQGKNVLLFDDVFRSGATMNEIVDLLSQPGGAASIRAFTITRTRSNQ